VTMYASNSLRRDLIVPARLLAHSGCSDTVQRA
jgi:hypothetical protein